MKKVLLTVALCAGLWVAATYSGMWTDWVRQAWAAGYTAVCGVSGSGAEGNCIKPNSDGSVSVNIGGGGSTVAIDQTTPGTTNGVSVNQLNGTSISTGTGASGSGTARTVTSSDSPDVTALGAVGDSSWTGSGNGSIIAVLKKLHADIAGATVSTCAEGVSITTSSTNSSNPVQPTNKRLCYIHVINTSTTISYLHLYDSATAPSCTSTSEIGIYPISPAPTAGQAGGFLTSLNVPGGTLNNGLAWCVTANGAKGDNNAGQAGIYINYGTN